MQYFWKNKLGCRSANYYIKKSSTTTSKGVEQKKKQ
jgi:hypothetical protein